MPGARSWGWKKWMSLVLLRSKAKSLIRAFFICSQLMVSFCSCSYSVKSLKRKDLFSLMLRRWIFPSCISRFGSWHPSWPYPSTPNHQHFLTNLITQNTGSQSLGKKSWIIRWATQVKGELVEKVSQTEMKTQGENHSLIHSNTICEVPACQPLCSVLRLQRRSKLSRWPQKHNGHFLSLEQVKMCKHSAGCKLWTVLDECYSSIEICCCRF